MKKIVTIFLLIAVGFTFAQSHTNGHLIPSKLDSVEVTGKAIVKTIEERTCYYLDTNSDGTPEYRLSFGPSWYKPVDSLATKPVDSDVISIIGGKYYDLKDSIDAIVVYQINGKVWRDPYYAEWNDLANRDSLKGFVHNREKHHGYAFGLNRDSIVTLTLTGTALVDTTLKMDRYFLDTDADSIPNYILNFGPFWYKPESGATRPLDGDQITISAGILGAKSKYPMAIVYSINGLVWRDSIIVHSGVGGKWLSSSRLGVINALFDSYDKVIVYQGSMMNKSNNEVLGDLFESYPENMPNYSSQPIVAAYELSLFDNAGSNMLFENGKSGGKIESSNKAMFQFRYTNEQLNYYGISENNLKVKYWNNSTNNWQTVNATITSSTNTASFETALLSNYYIITGSSVTSVETETSLPTTFDLKQNYPNPFNPTTTISYSIPVASNVSLKIYDILGNEVAQLVNEQKNAGNYSVTFDGKNLASGIYFYRLSTGSFTSVKKLTLIK